MEQRTLRSLTNNQRNDIAHKIVLHNSWRYIGSCFEVRYGWVINNDYLNAKYEVKTDLDRSEKLIKELVEKGITLAEFIAALKTDLVRLIAIASELMNAYGISSAEVQQAEIDLTKKASQPAPNNNNAPVALVEVNTKHAEEYFGTKLIFDIQGAVTIGYKELAKKVGWTRVGQLTDHMGVDNEIASLLVLIYKQQGNAGLKKIRDALASASEIQALNVIDNSPCAAMFQ